MLICIDLTLLLLYGSLKIFTINGLPIDKDAKWYQTKPYENFDLFEGDILFPDPNQITGRGVLRRGDSVAWTDGIVPYEITPGYEVEQETIIIQTMEKMERLIAYNNTVCIQFRPRIPSDPYYIRITNGWGCSSYIGQNTGITMDRTVTLQHPGCVYEGIIMHELLHALGFFHEQSRPDRDDYIRVNFENIRSGMEHNFEKYNNTVVDTQDTPYDYGSVMHYDSNAFSSNGRATIEPLLPGVTMGQRENMSETDIREVRLFYRCQTTGVTFPPTTTVTTANLFTVNTTVSSALTSSSPTFSRYNTYDSYYYESFIINVSTPGSYIFFSQSNIDTYGYIYSPSFSPLFPAQNLITGNDDGGGERQFKFRVYLSPNISYILVATTFGSGATGAYSVTVSGLTAVEIIRTNESYPGTFRTTDISQTTWIPSMTTIPDIFSTYMNSLTVYNPSYRRTGTTDLFYYEAIELTILVTGIYSLRSQSTIDAYGYLYEYSFDPENNMANLIASDDDSGGDGQFLINRFLYADRTYVLVFTTFRANVTAPFAVIGSGPYTIYYRSLISITTTSITSTRSTTRFVTSIPIISGSSKTTHHFIMNTLLNILLLLYIIKFT